MTLDPSTVERQGATALRVLSEVLAEIGHDTTIENQLTIIFATPTEYAYRLDERGDGGSAGGVVSVDGETDFPDGA